MGSTVATVNQQLLRGRQRLREALDAKYGRRADWRGFFLLALGKDAPPLPIGAPTGEWLGSLPAQMVAGALVLGGAVWIGEHLAEEPKAVLERPAIFVAPLVRAGRQEMAEKRKVMGGVDI